jgi:hypothetical protein
VVSISKVQHLFLVFWLLTRETTAEDHWKSEGAVPSVAWTYHHHLTAQNPAIEDDVQLLLSA